VRIAAVIYAAAVSLELDAPASSAA